MGKKFKQWSTLNLAKTKQTSAVSDGLGVDNIIISKSLESSKQHAEKEPLVKGRITFKELLKQSKNLKRYPASINIPETIKELEKENDIL